MESEGFDHQTLRFSPAVIQFEGMLTELEVMRDGESDPFTVRSRRNRANVHEWTPAADEDSDTEKEMKLLEKMKSRLRGFMRSRTCVGFLRQLMSPDFSDRITGILTSDGDGNKKMRVVVYGLGSIGNSDRSATHLCFALFLKRMLHWIGGIDVFDPVISSTEAKVLTSLGCYVVPLNEQCRRRVTEPTLFFMPHCDIFMYDNVLQANWRADLLSNVIILGNSFERYRKHREIVRLAPHLATHVFSATDFVEEVKLDLPIDEKQFYGMSWHFFSPPMELDESFARVLTMNDP